MLGFGRPYNNLSVPGFTVAATLALKGASSEPGLSPLILRGLGTEVDQAIALHPTFIAIWIDGNIQALPAGSIVLLSALPRLQAGAGIPPNFKTVPPFSALPLVGTPLTDAETITPAEQAQFNTRISEYNAAITAAAASRNIP